VTLEARGDKGLSSTRGTHGSNAHSVNELAEGMLVVLKIVPSSLVHKLTKDLDGWLSAVLFLDGHVKIVDENNSAHSNDFGAEDTSTTLVRFLINNVLNLVSASLSGETDLNNVELLFVKTVEKNVVNVN